MPTSVNCTSFRYDGKCIHQAAPRRLLGTARCIVWLWESSRHSDPRELPTKCALCTPRAKPILNAGEVNGYPTPLHPAQANTGEQA